MSSFNLSRNPCVRLNTTDWSASAATGTPTGARVVSTTGGGPAGFASSWYRVTATAATAYMDARTGGAGVNLVTAGTTYTFSSYMRPTSSATLTYNLYIQWLDVSSSLISTSTGTGSLTTVLWSRGVVTDVAPAGAVRAVLISRVLGTTLQIGDRLDVTAYQLEAAATASPYFDGDQQNYMWTAGVDASPSWGPVMSVVANVVNTPPRNEITITIPPGDVMGSAVVNRVIDGMPTPIRIQPATGFDSRLVYDYEAPYDTAVTYELLVTFTNPSGLTSVWSETWSNLTAWSGATGSWSVSGGVATGGDGTLTAYTITRAIPTPAKYRVTVASLVGPADTVASKSSGVFLLNAGSTLVQVAPTTTGTLQIITPTLTKVTSISGSSPFTIDLLDATVVISGTGGSYQFSSNAPISAIQLTAKGPGTTSVGAVTVQAYPLSYSADIMSNGVGLSPVNSWMIHPATPALSLPISSTDQTALMIRAIGDITDPSAATVHTILGQALPIITTNGPRFSNRLQLVLGVRNRTQDLALKAILQDGTPLLFRFPAAFDVGFDEGFYSVGDVTRARFAQRTGMGLRNVTLPLTEVQSPVVNVANSGWSYAALAAGLKSFATLLPAYNTFADMEIDNRNPGF